MHPWVKKTLRDTPGLRGLALRGGAMLRALSRAEPGLYTLCYHQVPAEQQARFAEQLRYLGRYGDFIDADTALDRLAAGWPRGDRAFLVTFDDGYACTADIAKPVLTALNVPAIVFLVSAWIDAPPQEPGERVYMTRADVAAWCADGLQIGSHSTTHARLSQLDAAQVEAELTVSRRDLAAISGQEIKHFACPWGVQDHDFQGQRDPALALAAGYRSFFTTRRGQALSARDFPLMPRHVVEPHWSTYEFEALLGGPRRLRSRAPQQRFTGQKFSGPQAGGPKLTEPGLHAAL